MNIRKQVAELLRAKADEIEATGEADGMEFAIFDFDEIEEGESTCLDTSTNANESYDQFMAAIASGRLASMLVWLNGVSLDIKSVGGAK